ATPGHGQQHPKQWLQCPARSRLSRMPRLLDLLPNLGREKLSKSLLNGKRRFHEPFLPDGLGDYSHSGGKRLFQLRELAQSSRNSLPAAEAQEQPKSLTTATLNQNS